MIIYEVYSHSIQKIYKTNLLSRGTLFQLLTITLTYLSPFLIAYYTNGFWLVHSEYTEQPTVHFKYKYIVLLETDQNDFLVSSSFQNINDVFASHYRSTYKTVQEIDSNGDSVNDYLLWSTEIPLKTNEQIISFKLLLLFNYTLVSKTNLQFESTAFIDASNAQSSSAVTTSGSLRFKQSKYLRFSTFNDLYSVSPINSTSFNLDDLQLKNILDSYYSRPFSTVYDSDYTFWHSSSNINTFELKVKINYLKQQVIEYIPGFWQQFKWGWIQYISILLPFIYVFKSIKIFIFQNQLIPTITKEKQN